MEGERLCLNVGKVELEKGSKRLLSGKECVVEGLSYGIITEFCLVVSWGSVFSFLYELQFINLFLGLFI